MIEPDQRTTGRNEEDLNRPSQQQQRQRSSSTSLTSPSSSSSNNQINPSQSYYYEAYENEDGSSAYEEMINMLEKQRRMKLSMLIQQLDYFFYILTVIGYYLDGKTLLLILKSVSEIQFCQPNQIQPGKPLRFFTLASLLITTCSTVLHLTLLSNDSNLVPNNSPLTSKGLGGGDPSMISHGLVIDFIGQVQLHNQLITVIFLLVIDSIGCLTQLLLVLLSFCDSNSIKLSNKSYVYSSVNNEVGEEDQEQIGCEGGDRKYLFELDLNESLGLFFSSHHPSSTAPNNINETSNDNNNSNSNNNSNGADNSNGNGNDERNVFSVGGGGSNNDRSRIVLTNFSNFLNRNHQ